MDTLSELKELNKALSQDKKIDLLNGFKKAKALAEALDKKYGKALADSNTQMLNKPLNETAVVVEPTEEDFDFDPMSLLPEGEVEKNLPFNFRKDNSFIDEEFTGMIAPKKRLEEAVQIVKSDLGNLAQDADKMAVYVSIGAVNEEEANEILVRMVEYLDKAMEKTEGLEISEDETMPYASDDKTKKADFAGQGDLGEVKRPTGWVMDKDDLEKAMDVVNSGQAAPQGPEFKKLNHIVKPLAMSLQVYKERGEFDGSLESAIECMKMAGYIEGPEEDISTPAATSQMGMNVTGPGATGRSQIGVNGEGVDEAKPKKATGVELDQEAIRTAKESSRGLPKEIVSAAKKNGWVFIHSYPNLDTVLQGGDLIGRPKVLHIDDEILVVDSSQMIKKPKEGDYVFIGVVRIKGVGRGYVERVTKNQIYISGMGGRMEENVSDVSETFSSVDGTVYETSKDKGMAFIEKELMDLDVPKDSEAWKLAFDNAMEASEIMGMAELKKYIEDYIEMLPNNLFGESYNRTEEGVEEGVETVVLDEADPSLAPPKKWFDKMYKGIHKENPSYSDEQARKTVGDIWYHNLSTKKRKEIRGREGKKYAPAEEITQNQIMNLGTGIKESVEPLEEKKLSSKERNKLPDSAFALPKERKYPIHNITHAKNALARSSGKPEEKRVKAAVYKKYPSLKESIDESLSELRSIAIALSESPKSKYSRDVMGLIQEYQDGEIDLSELGGKLYEVGDMDHHGTYGAWEGAVGEAQDKWAEENGYEWKNGAYVDDEGESHEFEGPSGTNDWSELYDKFAENVLAGAGIKENVSEAALVEEEEYEDVIFLQGKQADEFFDILDSKGKDAAMEYLKNWHYPGEHDTRKESPAGRSDEEYEKGGYLMHWNKDLHYAGLVYKGGPSEGVKVKELNPQPLPPGKEEVAEAGETFCNDKEAYCDQETHNVTELNPQPLPPGKTRIKEAGEEYEREEDDAVMSDSGPLGSRTTLSYNGKFVGEFDSQDEAEEELAKLMRKNKFFPNVWYVDDHGGDHLISKEFYKTHKVEGVEEKLEPLSMQGTFDPLADTEIKEAGNEDDPNFDPKQRNPMGEEVTEAGYTNPLHASYAMASSALNNAKAAFNRASTPEEKEKAKKWIDQVAKKMSDLQDQINKERTESKTEAVDEATSPATIKKYEALKTKPVWDKQEVLGVSHRLMDMERGSHDMDEELKHILHEILGMFEEGKKVNISDALTQQGIEWLQKKFFTTSGKLRNTQFTKQAGLDDNQLDAIRNFKKFELVNFKNYDNQVYAPVYRVVGVNNSFTYAVHGGWGGANFELVND